MAADAESLRKLEVGARRRVMVPDGENAIELLTGLIESIARQTGDSAYKELLGSALRAQYAKGVMETAEHLQGNSRFGDVGEMITEGGVLTDEEGYIKRVSDSAQKLAEFKGVIAKGLTIAPAGAYNLRRKPDDRDWGLGLPRRVR